MQVHLCSIQPCTAADGSPPPPPPNSTWQDVATDIPLIAHVHAYKKTNIQGRKYTNI